MRHKARPIPSLLVTGSSGQVGFELRRNPAPLSDVIALDRVTCGLTRPDMPRKVVCEYRPDVVVSPTAYAAVNKAEADAQTAFAVSSTAADMLAEETRALSSLLVHYSTDYVSDGTGDGTYAEADPINPQSAYGKSELASEEAIAQSGATALVIRTCWTARAHGGNSAKTTLELSHGQDSLRVVTDQFGAPTTAALITDVTAQIVTQAWLASDRAAFPSGVYHLAVTGETTWRGYTTAVLRYAKALGVRLKVDPDRIEAIPATTYPLPAPRPASSRVNTGKLAETFSVYLSDWQRGIHLLLGQILS